MKKNQAKLDDKDGRLAYLEAKLQRFIESAKYWEGDNNRFGDLANYEYCQSNIRQIKYEIESLKNS